MATATATTRRRKGGHADLARGSARSLLLTILGELVWPTDEPVRTSALLSVMGGLGFEQATARQAIVRGAESGWIEPHKRGREVSWTLTPQLKRVFEIGSQQVAALSEPFDDWDGRWLILFVTIPSELRATRKRLYSDLDWAGFGNPAPGVWLSPHSERRDQVQALISRLGLDDETVSFLGAAESIGISEDEIVRRGWDLDVVADDYAAVLDLYRDPRPSDDELLITHIRAVSELQRFPFSDPQLPEALLPDWIGRRTAAHLQQLRAEWTPRVRAQWAAVDSS